jgi:hypothetical protein
MYVGMVILEVSKLHMYAFFYDVLKPKFGSNIRLAYTDTDSFILHIYTSNLERHLKKLKEHFDFSNYPPDHPLYSNENNKVLGKFKDETASKAILEYVGLRPKCYAIRLADKQKLTCKGVKKGNLGTQLDFSKFSINCVFPQALRPAIMQRIFSGRSAPFFSLSFLIDSTFAKLLTSRRCTCCTSFMLPINIITGTIAL